METNVLTITSNQAHHVVFLDKQRVQISDGKTGKIQSMDFPSTMVKDGDIVDVSLFSGALIQWIKALSLLPGTVTLIIANGIYFGITLTKDTEKRESETKTFLETVPFTVVRSKQITIDTSTMEIAANREFYDQVRVILGSCALSVVEVLPLCVLDSVSTKLDGCGNGSICSLSWDTLKHTSILDPEEIPMSSSSLLVNKENPCKYIFCYAYLVHWFSYCLYLLFGR